MRFSATKGLVAVLLTALVGSWVYFLGTGRAAAPSATAPMASAAKSGPGNTADPYVSGPVKNTLRKNAAAMQQLWLDYLKQPQAKDSGYVEIDWRIDSEGRVSKVGLIHSEFADKSLDEGLVRIIQQLDFPPPGEAQRYVAHKFVFKKDAP
jgi:TonB family protein